VCDQIGWVIGAVVTASVVLMADAGGRHEVAQIHPSASIEPGADIGSHTRIWSNAQVRTGAKIGRNCVLGRNVFVDVDVVVGDNVKIQNNALLHEGVEVANGVFIGPSVIFTNDRVPRAVKPDGTLKTAADWTLGKTVVQDGASLGAGVVVITGVTVGRWSMIGSGSVVTRDVPDHALAVGNPARVIGWVSAAGVRCDSQAAARQQTHDER
jgi:acetyltransferase-like isoleucine patch superfamily enzyme